MSDNTPKTIKPIDVEVPPDQRPRHPTSGRPYKYVRRCVSCGAIFGTHLMHQARCRTCCITKKLYTHKCEICGKTFGSNTLNRSICPECRKVLLEKRKKTPPPEIQYPLSSGRIITIPQKAFVFVVGLLLGELEDKLRERLKIRQGEVENWRKSPEYNELVQDISTRYHPHLLSIVQNLLSRTAVTINEAVNKLDIKWTLPEIRQWLTLIMNFLTTFGKRDGKPFFDEKDREWLESMLNKGVGDNSPIDPNAHPDDLKEL